MSSSAKHVVNTAKPVVKRDVNKYLARLREFLMLRGFSHNQRHEFQWSQRNQPAPLIPGGFAHKLNKNYYFERDARRQVGQPQLLFSTNALNPMLASPVVQPQLTAGGAAATPQNSAAAAAGQSSSGHSSNLVTITEAEKQTAALLAEINKTSGQRNPLGRTPGKVYNWDG